MSWTVDVDICCDLTELDDNGHYTVASWPEEDYDDEDLDLTTEFGLANHISNQMVAEMMAVMNRYKAMFPTIGFHEVI